MLTLGNESDQNKLDIWKMCSRDFLFWVNTFVWTYNPKLTPAPTEIPFITYDFQDWALLQADDSIDRPQDDGTFGQDILFEKSSRDMGASWMCILPIAWRWQFREMQSFLMVSRKEEYVDKTGDPKCLFWKLDYIHKNQPGWLLPSGCGGDRKNPHRSKLHLRNPENGSVVDGESTTGDVARGDRRTAILLDEFAFVENGNKVLSSTGDATNCRLFNSTPNGAGNGFYAVRERKGVNRLRLHWSIHPDKAKGLYYDENGKPRSPWYDRECERRASALEIAQELDIDYLASGSQFFDVEVIDQIKNTDVCDPTHRGDVVFNKETAEFKEFISDESGKLRLWCDLVNGKPSIETNYSVGVDIATGTGASNSVISIADSNTGEKVGEWSDPHTDPSKLGYYAVALCHWFSGECGNAFMTWESNGPGRIFGKTVIDLGYRYIYYKRNENSLDKKQSDIPGWQSSRDSKLTLLGEYRRALAKKEFINRHLAAISECEDYVYLAGGGVAHQASQDTEDPSGARDNHGDRVIADALAFFGCAEQTKVDVPEAPEKNQCFAARRDRYEAAKQKAGEW